VSAQKAMSLEEILRHGQMEARHKVRLWVDLLRVLAEKHKAGQVFGTLSPRSILIDMQNNILLLETPFDPGSPYTAPEVLAGQAPDETSDIYSMGVIMFELLTGGLDGLHRRPPSRVAEGVPKWIDAIVLRCLMKRRSQRYLDLDELSQELVQVKRVGDRRRLTPERP
jgi:serine/threonine protein kinase